VPVITKEMEQAVTNVLENDMMVGGESVLKFEEEFANYIGTDYAVSTNSGSSALLLSFHAINARHGDKVVAPSATFIATLNGACLLGASPLFCEIGANYVISPQKIESILNKNVVKCIIPVHLYGHPCDMSSIAETAERKKVIVIEDAAQGHGAEHMNKKVGSFGDAAIFSFYPTKNMTVGGDGGMITTNNKKIYESALKMRDVGRRTKNIHDKIGYTLRLNSINAIIGKIQLKYLNSWNKKRRIVALRYKKKLDGLGDLILPPDDEPNSKSVYHMYVIRTKKRNLLGTWLSKKGISAAIHYPLPVHRQPAYRIFNHGNLTFTDEWSRTVLSIPMHPNLNSRDQDFIIKTVSRFFDEKIYEQKDLRAQEKSWTARLI